MQKIALYKSYCAITISFLAHTEKQFRQPIFAKIRRKKNLKSPKRYCVYVCVVDNDCVQLLERKHRTEYAHFEHNAHLH